MYSVVLMMAMSGGGEVPDFGRRGCNGCNGGGCSSSYGCNGGCHGGGIFSRRGGHGCHGGGYGCNGGGCHGGWSGCHGGCSGAAFYYGRNPYSNVTVTRPGVVVTETAVAETNGARPATIIVSLPADARLTFDGQATSTTAAQRVFQTPPLEPGYEYSYTLEARTERDGRPVTSSQRITVRAGQQSRVAFDMPAAAAGTAIQQQPIRPASDTGRILPAVP